MKVRIIIGDCRERLRDLADDSIDCCVSSPPYFGLRDYETGSWQGGDPSCDHVAYEIRRGLGMEKLGEQYAGGGKKAAKKKTVQFKDECGKCGARRVDAQIGLEKTPDEYVAELVAAFREVRRVLKPEGTLWLNLGDSYARNGGNTPQTGKLFKGRARQRQAICRSAQHRAPGIKPKELIGIPWMAAFALRADGWWLRQEIIWSKSNPMPESVTDRCTKSHEQIFLFTKSADYYFDAAAIAEDGVYFGKRKSKHKSQIKGKTQDMENAAFRAIREKRNKRTVWTVATRPYGDAHFATFPPDLIEPCILAGCPAGGIVLDPFGGAGTTALVAERNHRNSILIELNPKFADMAKRRLKKDTAGLFEAVIL